MPGLFWIKEADHERVGNVYLDHCINPWFRIHRGFYFFRKRYQADFEKIPKGETMNYQKLAEINFDNNEYLMAGLYYDSTLIKLEKKTKLYRQIKKKRDNLKDVILYENITKNNDSILALVNMNNADREEYFKLYIDKLKRKDEKLKESEKKTNH